MSKKREVQFWMFVGGLCMCITSIGHSVFARWGSNLSVGILGLIGVVLFFISWAWIARS